MNNKESNIEKTDLNAFIHAVGSEIQQAQVRLITAANAQLYSLSSATARMGKQNHQTVGKGDPAKFP